MKAKQFLALFLALLTVVVLLASCGGGGDTPAVTDPQGNTPGSTVTPGGDDNGSEETESLP